MIYHLGLNKKNILILTVCPILFCGCLNLSNKKIIYNSNTKRIFNLNQYRYNKYLNSTNNRLSFANKIVESIPDYNNLDEYRYFKAQLFIRRNNYNEILNFLKFSKNQIYKIRGYLFAALKYKYLDQEDKSIHLLKKANLNLSNMINKNKIISWSIYNRILQISVEYNELIHFEETAKELIVKSEKYGSYTNANNFLKAPLKKYLIKSYKKNGTYSKELFNYFENLSWNIKSNKTYKHRPISEKIITPPLLSNNVKNKAVALIHLAELYSEIDKKDKIKRIYTQVLSLWNYSMKNPNLGNSFDAYIPKFTKILYSSGFKKEALAFLNRVPDVYPYYYKDNFHNLSRLHLAEYKYRIKRYNKKAYLHKLKAYKNIVSIKIKSNDSDSLFSWIQTNIQNQKLKVEIISSILDQNITNPKFIEYYLHKNNNLFIKDINFKNFYTIYIPILKIYCKSDKQKANHFFKRLISEIDKKSDADYYIFSIRLAKELRTYDQDKSLKVYKKINDKIYRSKDFSPRQKINKIHELFTLYRYISNNSKNLDLELFLKKADKIIDDVPRTRNSDRYLAQKIDCSIEIFINLIRLKEFNRSKHFLTKAEILAYKINNLDLKTIYLKKILFKYAKVNNFKKAYEIFKKIDLEKTDGNLLIKKLNTFFDDYNETSTNWLYIDHDLDGIPSFCNPEAFVEILLKKCSKLDPDSDNDGIMDDFDTNPYSIN